MFRPSKIVLTSLTLLMIAVLSACNLVGQPAQSTTPTADLTAIGTTVAEQLTLNAPTTSPTSTLTTVPTLTIAPSETPAGIEATNTQGIIPVEETSAITPTATLLLQVSATPTIALVDGATAIPSFTPLGAATSPVAANTPNGPLCKSAVFNGDLDGPTDVQDGDVLAPLQEFTKGWAVLNNGTCTWDEGFSFRGWIGPGSMTDNPIYIRDKSDFVPGNGGVLIARVKMYAPKEPGDYVAHWVMYDDQGKPFGGDFVVSIKVVK